MSTQHTPAGWTKPDPKERCAACGMPRDAHWGAYPICAGRCTGFESSAAERVRAAAPELLAALARALTYQAEAFDADAEISGADLLEWFAIWREAAKAAVAKAEGRA